MDAGAALRRKGSELDDVLGGGGLSGFAGYVWLEDEHEMGGWMEMSWWLVFRFH